MGRHSGKRVRRGRGRVMPPTPMSITAYSAKNKVDMKYLTYGTVIRYEGQGGYATVQAYGEDGKLGDRMNHVPLKGSLRSARARQRLEPGKIVLIEDGIIVLVYQDADAEKHISKRLYHIMKGGDVDQEKECHIVFSNADIPEEEGPSTTSDEEEDSVESDDDIDVI